MEPTPRRIGPRRSLAAVAAALCVVLAACGGSDASSQPQSQPTYAANDPLKPQPLANATKVTLAVSAPVEVLAVPLLANELGEFGKENLDVELVPSLLTSDAMGMFAAGKLDALWGSMGAALLNSVNDGVDVKVVAPGGSISVGDSMEGYWARKELIDNLPASLKGGIKIGSAIGAGASHVPFLALWLKEHGAGLENVEWVQVPSADVGVALENGAVDMGYIGSPNDRAYRDSNSIQLVFKQRMLDAQTALIFGPNLLNGDAKVGEAIIRAAARTIRDHLQGNYKEDPDTIAALARALNADESALKQTEPLVWGETLEVGRVIEGAPEGTPPYSDFLQQVFFQAGGILTYDHPLPAEKIYDLSFRDAVMDSG